MSIHQAIARPVPAASSRRPPKPPVIVFSPLAWLKLQFFLHANENAVGGFGVSDPDDPLYIEDFTTVRQVVTPLTVDLDDAALADHFDRMINKGHRPRDFLRVWVHTRPGASAGPSDTDERTFARAFGNCDWAVLLILSRCGDVWARLQFNTRPGASVPLSVRVDWSAWPSTAVEKAGDLSRLVESVATEYLQNVVPAVELAPSGHSSPPGSECHPHSNESLDLSPAEDFAEKLAALEAMQFRRAAQFPSAEQGAEGGPALAPPPFMERE